MTRQDEAAWQPTASLQTARLRAAMLRRARQFFDDNDILEVTTAALSDAAVSDVHLESIEARLAVRPATPFFLHTSPEFAMKRLLCAGWPDIYQICTVFRDGEVGARHQPEFTMVEWYRLGDDFRAMMEQTVEFLSAVIDNDVLTAPAEYREYAQVFADVLGVDVAQAGTDDLRAACAADASLQQAIGEQRDDWLDYLLSTRIAATFPRDRLTVLHHYPATQAALSRLCPSDKRYADRFEVFVGDYELANGYAELRDAAEQEARMQADQRNRRRLGRPLRPLDKRFLAGMRAGLPACCGVAVGFDRLVMLASDSSSISDVQPMPAIDDRAL